MGWLTSNPVAYPIGPSDTSNLANLEAFVDRMRMGPDRDFMSDVSVLDDGNHKFIVVRTKKGGPIVAYALLRQDGEDAELEQLYSSQKGKGYGALALRTVEAVAKRHGARRLWLMSVEQATSFYHHSGYASSDGELFTKAL